MIAPGPWSARGTGVFCVDHGRHYRVCTVAVGPFAPDCVRAHQRLLAAAPEMLDVLRRAADAIEALDGTTVENEKLVDGYRTLMAKVGKP